jgi:predicted acylesterase/phospholipase RssA
MQAGMLRALYERGIVPDLIVGTSAGALNAAFVASRPQTAATRRNSRRSGDRSTVRTSSRSARAR